MTSRQLPYSVFQYFFAWAVHAFTASAACFGLLTLVSIHQHHYLQALWFMAITVFIDSVDGTLARLVKVKIVLPNLDGALLDNIVDYLNYVITPCFFLLMNQEMLPVSYRLILVTLIIIASSYQFCQTDAKTFDHFFKGFPCYWNIVVFYMYIFNTSALANAFILTLLVILIFIPIKYVYPSRLDYLTTSKPLKIVMHLLSVIFGISSMLVLWHYPTPTYALYISIGYVVLYLYLSLYRTLYPVIRSRFINT